MLSCFCHRHHFSWYLSLDQPLRCPIAEVKLRSAVFDLASSDPLALFGSDEVIDQFPNRKIYVGKKEGSNLHDLYIFEMNSQNLPMRVINARRGTLEVDKKNEQILLHVYDARYEERDKNAPDDLKKMRHGITMREGVMPISLEELLRKARNRQRPNELTLDQLQGALEQSKSKSDDAALKTEVSKRFSNAMAVFTFVLIGIPLAITAQRKETSVGIALSLIVAFSYFIIIVLTDNVKHKPEFASGISHLVAKFRLSDARWNAVFSTGAQIDGKSVSTAVRRRTRRRRRVRFPWTPSTKSLLSTGFV